VSILDDADPDILISRLAGPLATPADRTAFRRAAEAALAQVPCWGEGAAYRAVSVLQRDYFDPPSDLRMSWDITHEGHISKLIQAPPIEQDHDRRFTRHPRPMR
jgi:hypothetical protein